MKIIKTYEEFTMNENFENNSPIIVITKDGHEYDVNYQIEIDGNLLEIEGTLKPYNTGRSEEFEFEPSYFLDDEVENYYDENWETIEDQILKKFYE